jgi:hypothetical protein
MSVIQYNKLNIGLVSHQKVNKNGKYKKLILNYGCDDDALIIKLPNNMKIPYGYNVIEKDIVDKNGETFKHITKIGTMNFDSNNDKHSKCKKTLGNLDKSFLQMIKENEYGLFTNTPDITDIYNSKFSGVLNYARQKNTSIINEQFTGIRVLITEFSKIIDKDKNEYKTEDYFTAGTKGCPVVKINNIYANKLKYGVNIELLYFIIEKPPVETTHLVGYFNNNDSDSD